MHMSTITETAPAPLPLAAPNATDWMTINAAAFLLGVHKRTVERMVKTGTLAGHRAYGAPRERVPIMLWRAQVNEVLDARLRLQSPADAR